VGGTVAQLEAAKDVWRELKQAFEICQATEKARVSQIVEAIDPIYLRSLLNRATGQYATSIRAVVTHLFATHGKITPPQQVKATEQSIYGMHYDITQPVDIVFNTIEDLADLAEHANSPMSEQQQIDMAYVILARQPILQHNVRLWHRRLLAERTWVNMEARARA
jgi:heptaprenylglyceryl phosphate synthase